MAALDVLTRMANAVRAFREAYVAQGLLDSADFEDYEARKVRYDVLMSMYDNSTYRDHVHAWAQQYRANYQLYKAIRNIYNPTNRCVEFWKWMIWGGLLDEEALEAGAIPIRTKNQKLRPAIAKIWKWSNWQANKDLITQYGAEMGDVGIKIVDDPDKQEVRFEIVHPKTIKDLTLDANGYVKGYKLQEIRWWQGKKVTFEEECWRDADGATEAVHFATYKDGQLFAWNGKVAEWTEEYGFVPFVAIQHIRTGMRYGWAEIHSVRVKIHELDDLSSKLHDYIRKVVDPIWLFNFKKPKDGIDLRSQQSAPTTANPQPVREELPAIFVGDSAAKAQALVTSDVDITKTAAEIQNVIAELERDLPELQMDIWTAGQYTTGKALRNARQRVERKVIQRRPEYDQALIRAHQMAVAIAGEKNYDEAFSDFNLASYDAGDLDHTIPSDRRIFDTDTTEEMDKKKVFWDTVVNADRQGLPVAQVLRDLGKSEDWVAQFESDYEKAKEEKRKDNPLLNGNVKVGPDGKPIPVPPGTNGNQPPTGNSNEGGTPKQGEQS